MPLVLSKSVNMKNKNILYLGNDLAKKSNYNSAMETLSALLIKEKYNVQKSSNKTNKVLRLLDMCFTVLKNRNKVDYILIDTFSTSNFYYAFLTSQLARVYKIKYIPILHGGNLPKRINNSRWMSNLIFNNSYKNIAPSGYLKDEFEKYGYKTILIPNTIPIDKYTFKERKIIHPKLLFVRAFAEIYNPKMAIEVLLELKKTHPKAQLCMIGPDRDGALVAVKKLIDKYRLTNSVEITGVLSKEKWHEKSREFDVFINTTNVDNTPVSVMEAMALGLPVVATNVGGIPDLVNDSSHGLLVSKNDVDKMVAHVISLIEGNHKNLAKKARKKVENFSWEVVKKEWLKILL
jgi:colanic acid/amylovoran biosynthesis glycosyltransferase